ncbi:MAG TPA: short-chain dehydrogenase [Verrucomicrobiales bacterium]|nr:short-chain dehydrogenase [Verrucomicrobiales bacterium]
MRLQDQVILITGSTTGIGEFMARRFVAEGAKVILHGRDSARGEALRKELGSDKTAFCQGSLEDPAYPEKLAADAIAAFGKVDALVNNAALTSRGRITETDSAFFDRMMAVNARAPMLLIRALLPELKKNQGVVLNIGSVLAYCGQANMLAYSMSKGALMTMTRNLADSLGMERVRVNQLNVGWTLSDNEYQVKLGDGLGEGWPERLPPSVVPMGRLLMPEDIAAAAVYWVGRESYPVTGTVAELEQYPIIGRYANAEGDAENQKDHSA